MAWKEYQISYESFQIILKRRIHNQEKRINFNNIAGEFDALER